MDVCWLEQGQADVPPEHDWLSASEVRFLERLRFAPRRAAWRLGRWTAKRAVAAYLKWSDSVAGFAKIEVRASPSGAPEISLENQLAPVTISLSHRNDRAICAVAPPGIELGCDLERIEPRSETFLADYFATEEQALVRQQPAADRAWLLALLWSGKESALKALRAGLRLDTRCVMVGSIDASIEVNGWSPFQVRYSAGQIFHGWWQNTDSDCMVRTVVAAPPPAAPIPLKIAHDIDQARRNRGFAWLMA